MKETNDVTYSCVTDTRQRDAIRKVMAGPVDLGD